MFLNREKYLPTYVEVSSSSRDDVDSGAMTTIHWMTTALGVGCSVLAPLMSAREKTTLARGLNFYGRRRGGGGIDEQQWIHHAAV